MKIIAIVSLRKQRIAVTRERIQSNEVYLPQEVFMVSLSLDAGQINGTYRGGVVRIIGAGYWRKGKAVYETENHLHE